MSEDSRPGSSLHWSDGLPEEGERVPLDEPSPPESWWASNDASSGSTGGRLGFGSRWLRPALMGTASVAVVIVGAWVLAAVSANTLESPTVRLPWSTPDAAAPPSGQEGAEPSETPEQDAPPFISARDLLDTLDVKGRAPRTGYDRVALFGQSWLDLDGDGCSTREEMLKRDLVDVVMRDTCVVESGTLLDPFTGQTIEFARGPNTSFAVQIDHVVALSNAWQTGAQQLSADQRVEFANDPLNLLAVDGEANQQKSDSDAATWLPPAKSFRCQYVARQVSVKAKYGLWVTPPEYEAIARILDGCPDQAAISG